jgi:hypothetical protein
MNLLQNFFHVQHARELVDEYGIVGGIFVGVFAAVELSHFPFWHAVDDLMHGAGKLYLEGAQLKYQSQFWDLAPPVKPGLPLLSETHSLDLRFVLLCIVLACILGSITISKARKKRQSTDDPNKSRTV